MRGLTYREALMEAEVRLQEAGVPEAKTDAFLLLEHVSGLNRASFFLRQQEEIPEDLAERFRELVDERSERVPLQHLLGTAWFMGLPFLVDSRVLIPRQDTENLAELVLARQREGSIPPGAALLDMCTGSGCLAVSLAALGDFASVTAADLSGEALEVARENAARNNVPVEFAEGDLFAPLAGRRFDVIVSNPPYIPTEEIAALMPEVRDHDPRMALDGSGDGLAFYRRLAAECPEHLVPGGRIFFEIGWDQGEAVRSLLEAAGFSEVEIRRDDGGKERMAAALWAPGEM